jgi:hypothetical protein
LFAALARSDADGFVKEIGYDPLDIKDPNGAAMRGSKDGVPFVTIEDVDVIDGDHIVIANDNNLPYSAGSSCCALPSCCVHASAPSGGIRWTTLIGRATIIARKVAASALHGRWNRVRARKLIRSIS